MLGEIASSFSSLVDEEDVGEVDAPGTVGNAETDAQMDDGVTADTDEAVGSPRASETGDSERRNRSDAAEVTVRDSSGVIGTRTTRVQNKLLTRRPVRNRRIHRGSGRTRRRKWWAVPLPLCGVFVSRWSRAHTT